MKEFARDLAATVSEIAELWPSRQAANFVSGNTFRHASNG
jgi:hypothetical protein